MIDSITESAGGDLKRSRRKNPAPLNTGDRLPPHSPEAEQGVLGCILLEPAELLGDVMQALPDSHAFYDLRHQCIYDTMRLLEEKREPVEIITLQQRLKERGLLEQVGGIAYLNELSDAVPSAANLSYYLAIVSEKFMLRRWLALSAQVAMKVYEHEGEVDALVSEISTDLFALCESGLKSSDKTMAEVMADVQFDYLDKFRRGVKHKIGPMTGFNYLDNILPGLGRGQLIVLAARPRTGKSAMMMQMAEHIALVDKIPVAVFSLEMTATSLGARAVFERAGADLTKFLNGFMEEEDVQKLCGAQALLAPLPLRIDEAARMSIEDLEIRARRLVRRHNTGVIFIDYFQLLYVRNRHKQWSKSDELAEVSMRLKGLAKELKIPIVLCAQMNREIEKETHRRPRLSDLRDTGQLEQDADVVMFLWKPDTKSARWKKRIEHLLPRVPVPEDWKGTRKALTGEDGKTYFTRLGWNKQLAMVTCTVEKQREGRSGEDADLVFIKPWTRFVDAWRPEDGEPSQQNLSTGEDDE